MVSKESLLHLVIADEILQLSSHYSKEKDKLFLWAVIYKRIWKIYKQDLF